MQQLPFLHSSIFWKTFVITGVVLGLFFAWELGQLPIEGLPVPPRNNATDGEKLFTFSLIILIGLNMGLFFWRRSTGTCPVGTRRATGTAAAIGAIALLCPVCLLIPISFLGVSVSLFFLAPYLPLLRAIAIILLVASTVMLWPRESKK